MCLTGDLAQALEGRISWNMCSKEGTEFDNQRLWYTRWTMTR